MKKIFIAGLFLSSICFASASIDTNLKYGMRSQDVTELQEFLNDRGFLGASPSGFFGAMTLKAVKNYQTSVFLPNTGYVGVLTRESINKALALDLASSTEAEIKETGTTTPVTIEKTPSVSSVVQVAPVVQTQPIIQPTVIFQNGVTTYQPIMESPVSKKDLIINTDFVVQTSEVTRYDVRAIVYDDAGNSVKDTTVVISGTNCDEAVTVEKGSGIGQPVVYQFIGFLLFKTKGEQTITVDVPAYGIKKDVTINIQ